jgi:hypothetical protein
MKAESRARTFHPRQQGGSGELDSAAQISETKRLQISLRLANHARRFTSFRH